MQPSERSLLTPVQRIRVWYGLLIIVFAVFLVRLFYLQIIRHDYYKSAALTTQLKQYEIAPERGVIEVRNGDNRVPIVLNEASYTAFADPELVNDPAAAAEAVQKVFGGSIEDYKTKMQASSRYEVLAKRLTKQQHETITELEIKGVLTREVPRRTYPQGSLAAQLLGFVDDEGEGKYGLEQALNDSLKGSPGQLKAITDANGVPLAANKDNIITEPQNGSRVLLTIDLGMQQQLETILREGVESARSTFGSAVIMDVRDGSIIAMANYPTYDPATFFNVSSEDVGLFENAVVSGPLEVGSIMKPLTLAAALDQGVVSRDSAYYDSGSVKVDGATITNVEEAGGAGQRTMGDILQLSLNTGATWLLMQMGGGEINERARTVWHEYMSDRYQLGRPTGIEQGYEAPGSIPDPTEGFGLNIQFANTAFGQGMTATPLQMAAALASVVNGGTYYQPRLVESITQGHDNTAGKHQPNVIRQGVVSSGVSKDVRDLMAYAFSKNHRVYGMPNLRDEFTIGGKTGTAQIPRPEGGYYEDRYNGMFMGFVGGNEAQYVIVVRVDDPKIPGYAGSKAAGPVFVRLANVLIDNFGVTPKN